LMIDRQPSKMIFENVLRQMHFFKEKMMLKGTVTRDLIWLKLVSLERS